VRVAVDDATNVADLSAAARENGVTLDVVVEVDAGMERCGVRPGEPALALARAVDAAPALRFQGLHAYEGHVVQHPDRVVRQAETEKMWSLTLETRDLLRRHGIEVPVVTGGGTGTYDITGAYPGVTEVQAGSYVYMDPGYHQLVPTFELAFSVLCTVLSRPTPDRVVTDGGLQVLASDDGTPAVKGHAELSYLPMSEEHGSFGVRPGDATKLKIGDVVEVHPGHCCSAANLHDQVFAVRAGVVEAVWRVTARGRSQ
jgi:D-serine deaminase-like pyridoxal phosphate-dependent protein